MTSRRVTLLTYGSRGDVEPFIALGIGLQQAGYRVRLAAPAKFETWAVGYGLEFAPIQGNPDDLAQAFADQAGLSGLRMIGQMVRHVLPLARSVFGAVEAACSDADLIVHSFMMTDAGHTSAVSRGVPEVSAQFFPVFLSTAAFPAVAMPDLPLGGGYRRLTHWFNTSVFRHGARFLYNFLRRSGPRLPDLAGWPFSRKSSIPLLFAYSPVVLPRPVDWPETAQVCGYWRLPVPQGWQPPADLADFLAAGPPPVYFSPGSIRSSRMKMLLQTVVSAARACGQRVLLGVPPSEAAGLMDAADIFVVGDVPHAWLFPRMSYILHHGGAGTTGAAAASGVPNSALPFSADQAFWARRLVQLGVGPAAPAAGRLSAERLETVLREGLTNPAYRQRAALLAQQMQAEDGVGLAVRVVQEQMVRAYGPEGKGE